MKVTIEFDGTEEQEEVRTALDGLKWKISMWETDQWLRSQTKYAPDSMSDDTYKAFEECREKLREILADNNLQLD